MKYTEIRRRYETLAKICNGTFPRKISAAIARNIITFESELGFYDSQRQDIAARYAKRDSDGSFVSDEGNYAFNNDDDKRAFIGEVNELNLIEVEPSIMKFDVSELAKCDTNDRYTLLTPAQEASISWMIDFGEEPDLKETSDAE